MARVACRIHVMSDGAVPGAVFVVSAVRTPIGKLGGASTDVPASALGGIAIQAAVKRASAWVAAGPWR